ncbi:hypothetical protein [Nitrosomonas oligotropha]|uniref:Uncharacterized protein n=1 Tax=Nitrosomonas oligotropha TaxID=42354 RepID=A0A1H8SZU0_9PROT|nr:hypothetical protein [Nitrosomonas oligotropha]SDX19561.1 hypothetical protein SAMN05216300_12211 [Nitrosomonas oligotropha]SEO83848.1 hypothetical protein SAMN05216333_12111 [Nitrosomonas oligotropha]
MSHLLFQKAVATTFAMITLGYAGVSGAHEAGATMDPDGTTASFTGYALVTCIDDVGVTDRLVASIKDTSPPLDPPQDKLLVSLQIIKGSRAASTTDPVSGDGNFSPEARVQGGSGVYQILVNKTIAGARSFIVSYHCMTASNEHTATEITVKQFE